MFWSIMTLMCLTVVCLGHAMQGFVLHPMQSQADEAGEPVMAEPSMSPIKDAVVGPSLGPTRAAPVLGSETKAAPRDRRVVLTVAYDNNPYNPRLRSAWGFACLIETAAGTILFDTGGDGAILTQNMATLGIDPAAIDAVVLSHNHNDHTGGLDALLASNDHLVVYVPASFATEISRLVGGRAGIVEVGGSMGIIEGVHTTGEIGATIIEQSLIVETARGLVVVTGCAHPGIVDIARRGAAQGEIDLVIGGFHLRDRSRGDVHAVIEDLAALGVRRIAPCHCTGAEAMNAFEAAFGLGFVPCGVGTVITIEP